IRKFIELVAFTAETDIKGFYQLYILDQRIHRFNETITAKGRWNQRFGYSPDLIDRKVQVSKAATYQFFFHFILGHGSIYIRFRDDEYLVDIIMQFLAYFCSFFFLPFNRSTC